MENLRLQSGDRTWGSRDQENSCGPIFPKQKTQDGEATKNQSMIPHRHRGSVELCYNPFCTKITTTAANAAVLGLFTIAGLIWAATTLASSD